MWPAEPERLTSSPFQGESEALGSAPQEELWVGRGLHRCSLTGQQSPPAQTSGLPGESTPPPRPLVSLWAHHAPPPPRPLVSLEGPPSTPTQAPGLPGVSTFPTQVFGLPRRSTSPPSSL